MVCSRASTLAAALLLASVTPTFANLVANGGFESCTTEDSAPPPGWSGTAECDHFNPDTGNWAALFLPEDVGSRTLSQTIATIPGSSYDFSFSLSFNGTDIPADLAAFFGADEVFNLVIPDHASAFDYVLEDFRVVASAPSTTISFVIDPGDGAAWVDDVSATSVPEPATWVMMLLSAVALASLKGSLPFPRRRIAP
jgi:hypothetical protein